MKKVLSISISIIVILSIVTVAYAEVNALPGTSWWTSEIIQNIGSSSAAINMVAYDSASASTYSKSDTLAAGGTMTYYPYDFTGMPSGFQGSMVVSADQDIRAIVMVNNSVKNIPGGGQLGDPTNPSPGMGAYQGTIEPGTPIHFPIAKYNSFNKTTYFAVQNAGAADTTITATFRMPSGNCAGAKANFIYSVAVPTNKMVLFSPADATSPSAPPIGDGCEGSLTVTSTGSISLAGSAMEFKTNDPKPYIIQSTRAFTPSDYDDQAFAPVIKYDYFDRNSVIYVQNVTGSSLNVVVTFRLIKREFGNPGTCTATIATSSTAIPANETKAFPAANYVTQYCQYGATIDADSGSIVATVDEDYISPLPVAYPQSQAYNAFPGNQATRWISLPVHKEDALSLGTSIIVQNTSNTATTFILTMIGSMGTFTTSPMSLPAYGSLSVKDLRLCSAGPSSVCPWYTGWVGTVLTPLVIDPTYSCNPPTGIGCGQAGKFGVYVESTDANAPIVAIMNETGFPWSVPRTPLDWRMFEGFNLGTDPTP